MKDLIQFYEAYLQKLEAYSVVLAVNSFDTETIAPEGGEEIRNRAQSYLAQEVFAFANSEEAYEKLTALQKEDKDEVRQQVLDVLLRDMKRSRNIPSDLVYQKAVNTGACQAAWKRAKDANDYSLFKPSFFESIELTKKEVSYMPSKGSIYDTLLDIYEPGMTVERYDAFFATLREKLVPFIKRLNELPQIDDRLLFQKYDIEKQKQVLQVIQKLMNFDSGRMYMAESAHPFSNTICLGDGRITVRYLENSLLSAIYAFVHEYGHCLYGLQVDPIYSGTPLINSMSMGMHESQSRLMENHIGRSKAFIETVYPSLQEIFPRELTAVPVQDFYRMVNAARCSLIRIEADELTYPLHIMVRYEVEKAIFNDHLDQEQIRELWNAKYKEYLGLDVTSDAEGILQDVHFSMGAYGYFPTYALGSAFAAQFFEAMSAQIDVDACIREHRFAEIQEWLAKNIHRYSSTVSSYDLVEQVSGKPFDANIYADYLISKFSTIYGV